MKGYSSLFLKVADQFDGIGLRIFFFTDFKTSDFRTTDFRTTDVAQRVVTHRVSSGKRLYLLSRIY